MSAVPGFLKIPDGIHKPLTLRGCFRYNVLKR